MSEPTPRPVRRRRRLVRFAAAVAVLCALAGYLVVQYVTGGTARACKVVAVGNAPAAYRFTPEQAVNAATIAAVGTGQGMPERAVAVALATALQESGLRNLAHGDRDSVGLFQQRPSQGWGTEKQIMDPAYAAGVFFEHLAKVPDYARLPVTVAAQRVQRSGFPEAYAKHEQDAALLAAALTGQTAASLTCQGLPAADARTTAMGTGTGTGIDAGTAVDALRAALVRDFGPSENLQEAGAQVGGAARPSPKPSPTVTARARGRMITLPVPGGTKTDAAGRSELERGWQLAQWAVANASALHIRQVSYAGRQWSAGSTDSQWRPIAPASAPGAERTTGSVRIVTGQ
ncbi:heavy metal transporter [Streptomyces sp. NPDC056161]|uniref:heavy metal transporter n=1 Tax=Streptomyces sp. NPDC056161 TaxID=3345732 RepID=UPI0035DB1A12